MVVSNGRQTALDLARLAASAAGDLISLSDGPFTDRSAEVPLPSMANITGILDRVRLALFPGYLPDEEETAQCQVERLINEATSMLIEEMVKGGCFAKAGKIDLAECRRQAEDAAAELMTHLPDIRVMLSADAKAAYLGDPACVSPYEPVVSYPSIEALIAQRIAHVLHNLGVPLVPRMLTEVAHSRTGIDIHPGARLGPGLFIDHGTGVVIGETCVIGRGVKLYQGVTLGAASFPLDADGQPVKGIPRHPIVEDNVTIYAQATVLGRVTIGAGSVIGGNVWLTKSVPPGSRVMQQAARRESFNGGGGI